MRKLDNRRDTAMAGLPNYRHHEVGTLRTNFSGDILGKSDGMRFDATLTFTGLRGDKWSVQPGVRNLVQRKTEPLIYEYGITRCWNPAAAVWMNTVRAAAGHAVCRR